MIVYAPEAPDDLDRICDFHNAREPGSAALHIGLIVEAVSVLSRHPLIGRLIASNETLRELVIGHGATGYVALYEHSSMEDLVRVVAVRHQREAGYIGH